MGHGQRVVDFHQCLVDHMPQAYSSNRKAMASLIMFSCWVIWSERNAWVFRNKYAPLLILLANIKEEAALWSILGAKHLGKLMLGE